jgi:hypothetical protein
MFERWFRQQGFFRKAVDDETRDAILDAERARVTAWVERRKLSSNIEVDDGCVGPVPEGVTITIRIAGVDRAKLVPLLDDIDLDGSLRKLLVEKAWVRLFFVPLRSTDVYDIALRRVEELLSAPEPTPEPPERNGPYR